MSSTLRRAWLLVNVALTVALLPALFPNQDGGSATAVAAGSSDMTRLIAVAATPSTMLVPTTTTTTAPPRPAPRKVAARRSAPKTTTTTAVPKPRVKPAAPAPTIATQTAPPAASGSESGRATWYDYEPGICAHKTLPFGTVVTVHASNGTSVQCTVGDRGPYVDGYVIDLHWREFEQLAPRSAGRIDCTITW